MTTSDFNLGDFLETLPYEGGLGSVDEYVANSETVKRLKLRNEEIKPGIKELVDKTNKAYLPSSDDRYYINYSERSVMEYSPAVTKLEAELADLKAKIASLKDLELKSGVAKQKDVVPVLSVRRMTDSIQARIAEGDDELEVDDGL